MITSPEVGSFSRSRSRASTSPEAISIKASSCRPGIVADQQAAYARRRGASLMTAKMACAVAS